VGLLAAEVVEALSPAGGELVLLRGPDRLLPTDDVGVGPALLAQAAAAGTGGWLRLYRPAPTVAFSRRDTLRPGFRRAAEAGAARGFTPVLRAPGGCAAAYHPQALCLDLVVADGDPHSGAQARFVALAEVLVDALTALGVPAGVGPVPGEYCPGRYSVNAAGRWKIAGTAQRVVRGAWFLGAVVLVSGAEPVREVVAPVYDELGLECDVTTVGAVADLAPGVGVEDVALTVLDAFARRALLTPGEAPPGLVERARLAAPEHPDLTALAVQGQGQR
jgi:octanoyl-[GcvH]:protein N-octanoyltransferase